MWILNRRATFFFKRVFSELRKSIVYFLYSLSKNFLSLISCLLHIEGWRFGLEC